MKLYMVKKYDSNFHPEALKSVIIQVKNHCNNKFSKFYTPSFFSVALHFCKTYEISMSTYNRWVKSYPEFSRELEDERIIY